MLQIPNIVPASSGLVKSTALKSKNLKRRILLSYSTRWLATPTQACITLTQWALRSQYIEWRPQWILNKCMFGPSKLVSKDRFWKQISIRRKVQRERIMKARVEKRQLQRVQLTVRVMLACTSQPLNPTITIQTLVYLNFQHYMNVIISPLPAVRWHLTMHWYSCSL